MTITLPKESEDKLARVPSQERADLSRAIEGERIMMKSLAQAEKAKNDPMILRAQQRAKKLKGRPRSEAFDDFENLLGRMNA